MSTNDNDSKTIDGSDGSTFQIDQGDRETTNDLRINRLLNTADADALFAEIGHKFDDVDVAQLSIPTAQEESRAALKGDAQESILGIGRDRWRYPACQTK